MFGHTARVRAALALFAVLTGIFSYQSTAGDPLPHAGLVRIGLVSSLFRDIPEATVLAMMQPLGALMESQTGVSGELVSGGDADSLGQQLAEDKLQLGVFHGIEFGWARQKHPELRALVIAVNQQPYLRAHLMVCATSKATSLGDLQDKVLALPHQTREHCYLYLRRRCQESKKEPAEFFSKITNPANAEDALDDLVDGVVQGAIVDSISLDCYKRRKPGRFAKLKTAQTSEPFPAAVVAYRPGVLDEATLKRFREGMINANRSVIGKQLMTLWKLTAFEPVPQDYERNLTEIVKAYPPPTPSTK